MGGKESDGLQWKVLRADRKERMSPRCFSACTRTRLHRNLIQLWYSRACLQNLVTSVHFHWSGNRFVRFTLVSNLNFVSHLGSLIRTKHTEDWEVLSTVTREDKPLGWLYNDYLDVHHLYVSASLRLLTVLELLGSQQFYLLPLIDSPSTCSLFSLFSFILNTRRRDVLNGLVEVKLISGWAALAER